MSLEQPQTMFQEEIMSQEEIMFQEEIMSQVEIMCQGEIMSQKEVVSTVVLMLTQHTHQQAMPTNPTLQPTTRQPVMSTNQLSTWQGPIMFPNPTLHPMFQVKEQPTFQEEVESTKPAMRPHTKPIDRF